MGRIVAAMAFSLRRAPLLIVLAIIEAASAKTVTSAEAVTSAGMDECNANTKLAALNSRLDQLQDSVNSTVPCVITDFNDWVDELEAAFHASCEGKSHAACADPDARAPDTMGRKWTALRGMAPQVNDFMRRFQLMTEVGLRA